MKVIVSTRARRELLSIGEWIEHDNPIRGATYVEELYQACRSLGDIPERYPLAEEFGLGIRKRSHGAYLILYTVGRQITIVSVRHSARRRSLDRD